MVKFESVTIQLPVINHKFSRRRNFRRSPKATVAAVHAVRSLSVAVAVFHAVRRVSSPLQFVQSTEWVVTVAVSDRIVPSNTYHRRHRTRYPSSVAVAAFHAVQHVSSSLQSGQSTEWVATVVVSDHTLPSSQLHIRSSAVTSTIVTSIVSIP